MPRTSARQRVLRLLEEQQDTRRQGALLRMLFDEHDEFEDEIDEYVAVQLAEVQATRYVTRALSYRKRPDRWQRMLYDTTYLNETEFLEHFRVARTAFHRLVALVKDDDVFHAATHRTFRGGVELHLMALLKYLGSSGNENTSSKYALFFGFGKGSTNNYVRRAVQAVLKLHDSVLTWPDKEERQQIALRFHQKYGFPNCVGVTDGTLLPLATKPTANGEDYYCRKGGYAINALITCDDAARIRDVVIGWPGSVHDNRVWSNTALAQDPTAHFCNNQYLLGDSAFQVSPVMIPAYKKPPRAELAQEKSYFNTKLAKARIKSEHSIGLLKARFQYFKSIRATLNNEADMRRIIEYFLCACIFQNLLIGEPVPSEWENQIRVDALSEDDELNMPVPRDAVGGERREQLLAYLLELRG